MSGSAQFLKFVADRVAATRAMHPLTVSMTEMMTWSVMMAVMCFPIAVVQEETLAAVSLLSCGYLTSLIG